MNSNHPYRPMGTSTMLSRRRTFALAAASLLAPLSSAQAQDYPHRPIRMVIPFGPGTGIDAIGRVFAQKMSAELGQPIVVDNKVGAQGMIGGEFAAKAPPDGYTLFFSSVSAVNPILFKKVPYDGVKSFVPISTIYAQPMMVATSLNASAKNLPELLALSRRKPGGVTAGVVGTLHRLTLQHFSNVTGARCLPVPYKGSMMVPLLAGEIDMMIDVVSLIAQQAKAGKLHALAVTSDKRIAIAPDVPTMQELGYPGFDLSTWTTLMGPATMPRAIVERLNAATRKVIESADFQDFGNVRGVNMRASTPEYVTNLIHQETDRWLKVAKDAGLEPE